MACRVLTTENFSIASKTLPLRRRPAVSISSNFWPARSKGTEIASRVVPGRSKATSRSSPSQVLIRVDLPTLGRPATASLMTVGSSGSPSSSGSGRCKGASAMSTSVRMPWPCEAETGSTSPRPSSKNSESCTPSVMPSALLAVSTVGLPSLRRYFAMSWSWAFSPARASTTNTTTSASATAWRVCLAISL